MSLITDQQIIDLLKELPTKKDLVILKSEILQETGQRFAKQKISIDQKLAELPTKVLLDQKLTLLRQDFDKTLDQKHTALRENMNKDFAKSVMPLVYNHDERLDRIDKNLDLPPIPVRLPQ